MDSEQKKFNQIFVENAWGSYHELQLRTFIPKYEDWLGVLDYFDVHYIEIDSHLLTPQRSSARLHFKMSPYSELEMPTRGTSLFSFLAQNPQNYISVYERIESFFSTAKSIHTTRPVSKPNITVFPSGLDVHPGNKLVTAHQILCKPVSCIEWCPKTLDKKPIMDYISKIKLLSLSEISEKFEGHTRAFIQKEPYRIHMWSDFKDWETDSNGYKAPEPFSLSDLAERTLKYPGVLTEFYDTNKNKIYGKVITDSRMIWKLFDEYAQ